MARKPEQQSFTGDGFEQAKIGAIERWANKYDAKRELIGGLEDELTNIAFKLSETMHKFEKEVDHQESPDGDKLLVYKRGDYSVVVKRGREKVNVKIKEKSKGEPTEEGADASDSE